jgi:[CysO sulfur-carrier protein]-S-L-cysteine hydrolase
VTQTLAVPHYLLDSIAAHGRTEYPREACGLLAGRPGRGPDRFVPIPNRHAEPERFYAMDDNAVIVAYGVMDELHQDPLVVYHTHPRSDAELSTTDVKQAWDLNAVYIVCSMMKSQTQPTFRAWRITEVEREMQDVFEGGTFTKKTREVEEVALDIVDEAHPDSPLHGLVEGNRVRIVWDSEGGRRTTVARVGPRGHNDSVTIFPERPGLAGPTMEIGLDRIRAVGILSEGANYAHSRAQAASFLQEAAMRLAACDTLGARDAVQRATLILPRIAPTPPAIPRAYRPLRAPEK